MNQQQQQQQQQQELQQQQEQQQNNNNANLYNKRVGTFDDIDCSTFSFNQDDHSQSHKKMFSPLGNKVL